MQGWYDCGENGTLLETNRHLLEHGRARAPDGGKDVRVHKPVRVAEGVTIEHAEIGPNVTIETGTVIRNTTVRDSIIGESCRIENAQLHDSIIGDHVTVKGVNGQVSLGDHSTADATPS